MRALIAAETIQIRNPEATRPWQFVLDPLCGYLILAERLAEDATTYGEAWNFGPTQEGAKSVAWIAARVVDAWGGSARWQSAVENSEPYEASSLQIDASKARARLHWAPRLGVKSAVDWTIDWYKKYSQGASVLELTEDQISRFCNLTVSRQ
jgi:CDP-glucose 4,6-dehydratase